MAISTNGTVLARLAGALYNTQMSNATYKEVAALDPSALANTLYARDFSSSTDLAVATTLVTNLGLSSITGLNNWVAAQLTAAGSAKGAKVVDLLNSFAQMTADTTYGAYATAFNTKVDAALALSQTTDNKGGTFAAAGVVVVTNATFTLTSGVDAVVGGAGDDVINAPSGTLSTLDTIDGGSGNDTLNLTQADAISLPFGATVNNVETINFISGAAVTVDTTTGFSGLTTLNAASKSTAASTTLTAASTTNIVATETDLKASGTSTVSIDGGKNVTVSAKGTADTATAMTASSGSGAEILIGKTTAPTGDVVVSNTGKGADGKAIGDIFVKGGKTVTITQSVTNSTVNETNVQGDVSVIGTADTTAVTVNQKATATASSTGLGVVGVTAGAVTITDKNAASSTAAGTITTVNLNNAGTATINSGALTTLNLAGKLAAVDAGTLGALTTPANTTLSVNLTGASQASATALTIDSDITTLNVSGNTTSSTITSLVANGAQKINVSGNAKVTFSGNTTGAVTDIVVTNTAGASFGTAIGAAVNFTGGDGADSVKLSNSFTKAISMGAGNDTVTIGGTTIGTGGSISGGDGTDTLVMTTAQALSFDVDSTFNSKVTGFEALTLSDANTTNDVVDVDGLNGVSAVKLSGAVTGNLTINNLVSGGTVTLTTNGASTPVLTVGVKSALLGASDTLNLALSKTGAAFAVGKVVAANVETVNIVANDAATTGSAAATNTLELAATSATTVTVAGNNGLTLTNTGNSKITNFDASGVVANNTVDSAGVAATTDAAADLAVTFASANTTATANVTIKGGAGNDVLSGTIAKDSIYGGAGADAIYADNAGTKEVQTLKVKTADGSPNGKTIVLVIDGIAVTTTLATADNSATKQALAIINAINGDSVVGKLVTAAATANAGEFTLTYKIDGNQVAPSVSGTSAAVMTDGTTDVIVSTGGDASSVETTAGVAGTTAVDSVDGGSGADLIVGGGGTDSLTGGTGADNFFFMKSHSNQAALATITDFTYAVGGTSNDKIIVGDVAAAAGTKTTLQDLSSSATLAAAFNAAALSNTVDKGLVAFIYGGDTYVMIETTGATSDYVAGDFAVKLTGTPVAAGTALAGLGFDGV